jgi:hypothetical protein
MYIPFPSLASRDKLNRVGGIDGWKSNNLHSYNLALPDYRVI